MARGLGGVVFSGFPVFRYGMVWFLLLLVGLVGIFCGADVRKEGMRGRGQGWGI